MNYEFNVKQQWLTPEQQAHITAFAATGIIAGKLVKNKDGEVRQVLFVRYPKGAITPFTQWYTDPSGQQWYYTPRAIGDEKVAGVCYKTSNGKTENTTSVEWMEWLGETYTVEAVQPQDDPLTKHTVVLKNVVAAGGAKRVPTEEFRRKNTEKDRWISPVKKQS